MILISFGSRSGTSSRNSSFINRARPTRQSLSSLRSKFLHADIASSICSLATRLSASKTVLVVQRASRNSVSSLCLSSRYSCSSFSLPLRCSRWSLSRSRCCRSCIWRRDCSARVSASAWAPANSPPTRALSAAYRCSAACCRLCAPSATSRSRLARNAIACRKARQAARCRSHHGGIMKSASRFIQMTV